MKNKRDRSIYIMLFILFSLLLSLSSQAQVGSSWKRQQVMTEDNLMNESHAIVKSITDGMCERIKNSKFLTEYADVAERVFNSVSVWDQISYDTQDRIISKWLDKKLDTIETKDAFKNKLIIHLLDNEISKCAFELSSTNLIVLFANSRNDIIYLINAMKAAQSQLQTKTIRDVDASGNIITKVVTTDFEGPRISTFKDGRVNQAAIPALIAIFDKENKFTSTIHPELQKRWVSVIAEVEDANKKDAEINKKSAMALQQQKELELKNQKQINERIEKIQKGDFKFARSCIEIFNVLGNKIDQTDEAALKPHQGLKGSTGKLARFSGDTGIILNKNSAGITAAEIKIVSNTLWFNKDDIRLNKDIFVVGKYTSNTAIKFANGSSTQSPVLELVCIQPISSFSF